MTQSHTHKEDEALQVVTDADVALACFHIDGDYYENSGTSKMRMRRALESFAASRPVAVGVSANLTRMSWDYRLGCMRADENGPFVCYADLPVSTTKAGGAS